MTRNNLLPYEGKISRAGDTTRYNEVQKALGMVQCIVWVPAGMQGEFQSLAEATRIRFLTDAIDKDDTAKIIQMAARNKRTPGGVPTFEDAMGQSPDVRKGGNRHKQAAALYQAYAEQVTHHNDLRAIVDNYRATNDDGLLKAEAMLYVSGLKLQQKAKAIVDFRNPQA